MCPSLADFVELCRTGEFGSGGLESGAACSLNAGFFLPTSKRAGAGDRLLLSGRLLGASPHRETFFDDSFLFERQQFSQREQYGAFGTQERW